MKQPVSTRNEALLDAGAAISGRSPRTRRSAILNGTSWAFVFVPVFGLAAWLIGESMRAAPADCTGLRDIRAAAHWFDPIFFQYTVCLGLIAILIVPAVPLMYATAMTRRKFNRLHDELPPAEWIRLQPHLQRRASPRYYLWATALTTVVVTLGVSIILLFKPAQVAGCGVNLGLGANMLLMGPYIELPALNQPYSPAYFGHLVQSLVGFQFGFLGAYIYFVMSLSRAYFTLDLTPETLIEGALRIAAASVVALILSFCMEPASAVAGTSQSAGWWLPAISFFFGFFPKRALAFLENIAGAYLKRMATAFGASMTDQTDSATTLPLSALHGMSYDSGMRLEREGFDSVETLRHANPADLAVRTGFCYGQLREWISEAWLLAHLREDYAEFVRQTGLMTRNEVAHLMAMSQNAEEVLLLLFHARSDDQTNRLRDKAAVLMRLCASEAPATPAALEPIHQAAAVIAIAPAAPA